MTSKVVRATEIAPEAFSGKHELTEKEDDLDYDLGNLCATDLHPTNTKAYVEKGEKYLSEIARDCAQLLFNNIFKLPIKKTELGPQAILPKPTTKIPREKPCPKPKEPTRWEKFASERGIKKRKRERMVFDEDADEFRPRWGYKRANDQIGEAILETKADGMDPFTKLKLEKQKRVIENQMNQLKNLKRTTKKAKGAQLAVAQRATGSLGKFDRKLGGEPELKRRTKHRKFASNTASIDNEQSSQMKTLAKMFK
eukprot:TRINITY_DN11507_c0_g1_i1.p1 TRINITY_DN11507_c0_g1~~TRINITY_DN11507_c0_g1_i1.p1  ORF type:complete len:265 (+),score=66.71 TRINITY_DN11507_c0_g1_i1:35-796(+)